MGGKKKKGGKKKGGKKKGAFGGCCVQRCGRVLRQGGICDRVAPTDAGADDGSDLSSNPVALAKAFEMQNEALRRELGMCWRFAVAWWPVETPAHDVCAGRCRLLVLVQPSGAKPPFKP